MARKKCGGNAGRAPRGTGTPQRPARWAAPLCLLLLPVGTAALAAGSAKPVALSVLDALVLVAVAVLAGTYMILARGDQKEEGSEANDPSRADGAPGAGSPPGDPSGSGNERRPGDP